MTKKAPHEIVHDNPANPITAHNRRHAHIKEAFLQAEREIIIKFFQQEIPTAREFYEQVESLESIYRLAKEAVTEYRDETIEDIELGRHTEAWTEGYGYAKELKILGNGSPHYEFYLDWIVNARLPLAGRRALLQLGHIDDDKIDELLKEVEAKINHD